MKTYRIRRSDIHSNGAGEYYAIVDTSDGRLNVHFDSYMNVTFTAFIKSSAFSDQEEPDDVFIRTFVNIEVI